jgi:cytochrome c oxidase cbb3-type subunit 3
MTSHASTADDLPTFGAPRAPETSGRDAAGAADDADEPDDARLMEHDYDGIREYDNPLPSWWSIVFGACIAFAFLYFAYYNIAGWGKTPAENYQVALAGWQASYKGGPGGGGGPNVTEEMLAAGAENPELVGHGAEVFANRCVGCHAPDGRGLIGPNLTDLFQIHGTTRLDLYGTILGGAPGTAMIAWGEVMKPTEIIAVATYVSTLRGKNVTGKAPQGKPVPALAR